MSTCSALHLIRGEYDDVKANVSSYNLSERDLVSAADKAKSALNEVGYGSSTKEIDAKVEVMRLEMMCRR